ncbi:MFS transporter [Sphingosinicella rhizophila]|uniref:MFS transporter n=1 Tax=Sphingosinicella rhizophila TaxID=3050082 RepID=A0ABU3Q6T3_9SPHN|nr:MFS transporter [Sphingosinicella sp. GR2756]MDT9598819.1 MFS transporter [Sphingosinicella sp. GR2756]
MTANPIDQNADGAPDEVGRSALRKAAWRLLPLLGLGYALAYIDRLNVSFAALQMNEDLQFSAAVYGLGAGLFFLTYALCEVPSNLVLMRVGARRWIARILVSWGAISTAMMFVEEPWQFYALRLLLGAAEAGFFPGAVYFLSRWFPGAYRGRAISGFYVALPLSTAVMAGMSGLILDNLDEVGGLGGWQWLFLLEGFPTILLGIIVWFRLTDRPREANWLTEAERNWLEARVVIETHALRMKEVFGAMLHPWVFILGAANFILLGSHYAFHFSAPTILKLETGLDATGIGYVVSATALLGVPAMLASSWYSDLRRDRIRQAALLIGVGASGYLLLAMADGPAMALTAYVLASLANFALQGVIWAIPGDLFRGRLAGVAFASIITIGMFGSFLAPIGWGALHDATGSYQTGILVLPALLLIPVTLLFVLRARARRQPLESA